MSETDAEFVDRLVGRAKGGDIGYVLVVSSREEQTRLLSLARRGAESADTITALRAEVEKLTEWNREIAVNAREFVAENEKLRAALEPFACTCDRPNGAACSRSEVDCPFWNARATLEERVLEAFAHASGLGIIPYEDEEWDEDLRNGMSAAIAVALEEAAKLAEAKADEWATVWRNRMKADQHMEGKSAGADEIAAAIRALKKNSNDRHS